MPAVVLAVGGACEASSGGVVRRFQFDATPSDEGMDAEGETTRVYANDVFSSKRAFGFEPGAELISGSGSVTGAKPFFFSAALPEGNYAVKITFGDQQTATTNTVKAEMRRLMLEQVITRPGEFVTRDITVNIRTPRIPGGDRVRLKQRELDDETVNWDEKLTLEFSGERSGLVELEIRRTNVPTVFLLGDSTVCDQPREPWNSWGQMVPRFFNPGIAIANHAQSGESIKSSLAAKRFDKVIAEMRPGDWLLLQFGHNDMKDKSPGALAAYKTNLKAIVARTRDSGGTPVLVTSMERKAGVQKDTLAGYPDAMREVAGEDKVALVDLHAMSKVLYRALGAELDKAFQDGTHHNSYGSYELARCVALGIHQAGLPLAKYLVEEASEFDPQHPDAVAEFAIPPSPQRSSAKPDGD